VRAGPLGALETGQHARDLGNPFGILEDGDLDRLTSAPDRDVTVRESGDLRQVGHDEYLVRVRQACQSPRELERRLDTGDDLFILDVREPNEYQINKIQGSTLIPLGEVPRRYQELDRDREIVVHCKMGGRSAKAVDFLRSVGFTKVKNLRGGILEWIDKVDPSQPKY
jgi:rhodanese-related sulfurtransferase